MDLELEKAMHGYPCAVELEALEESWVSPEALLAALEKQAKAEEGAA